MEKALEILLDQTGLWAPKVGGAILVILIFLAISRIIRRTIIKTSVRLKLDRHLAAFLARISAITIVIIGIVTALGTLGINVSAIVAGLGLTGFAVGFALKDTISNLLSGILILLYRPFHIGDTISVSGYEGSVVSIDLRYTELTYERKKILIPNSKLFTDPITVIQKGEQPSDTENIESEK